MAVEGRMSTRGHGVAGAIRGKTAGASGQSPGFQLIYGRGGFLDIGWRFPTVFSVAHLVSGEVRHRSAYAGRHGGEYLLAHVGLERATETAHEDSFFHVVTMLAVVEHLNPNILVQLFREIHRVLVPGGWLVATTPASWSDGLLKLLARTGVLSAEEISEHKYAYTLPLLGWYFGMANSPMDKIRFGYFECMLNMWATGGTVRREGGNGTQAVAKTQKDSAARHGWGLGVQVAGCGVVGMGWFGGACGGGRLVAVSTPGLLEFKGDEAFAANRALEFVRAVSCRRRG